MTGQKRCGICATWHLPPCVATDRTWPSAALIARIGSATKVAAVMGVARARMPELLTDKQADRLAVRCGLHPEQVWPGWCEAGLTVGDDLFVNGGGWRQAWEWAEAQRNQREDAAA